MYIWIDVVWLKNSGRCLHLTGGTANCYSALEPALGLGNGSALGEILGYQKRGVQDRMSSLLELDAVGCGGVVPLGRMTSAHSLIITILVWR